MKPTILISNSPILLQLFERFICDGQHQHGKVTTEEQHWRFTFARAFFDGISNLLLAIKRGLTLQYPTCAGSSLFQLKHFLYSEPGNDDTAAARTQNHPLCTTSYLLKTKRIDRGPCHSAMSQQATSPALAVAPELTQVADRCGSPCMTGTRHIITHTQ